MLSCAACRLSKVSPLPLNFLDKLCFEFCHILCTMKHFFQVGLVSDFLPPVPILCLILPMFDFHPLFIFYLFFPSLFGSPYTYSSLYTVNHHHFPDSTLFRSYYAARPSQYLRFYHSCYVSFIEKVIYLLIYISIPRSLFLLPPNILLKTFLSHISIT